MLARKLLRNDRGEVGVGTLIIFIAMVLVAAVAAAVIIGTAGNLQQRAAQTGKEATQEVSSNLKVVDIFGSRVDDTHDLQTIKLQLEMAAGGQPIDLTQVVLRYSDGQSVINYASATLSPSLPKMPFTLTWVRGQGTNNVMESGDLVELSFDTATELAPRTSFEVQLLPEVGSPVDLALKTPSTYYTDTTISLTK